MKGAFRARFKGSPRTHPKESRAHLVAGGSVAAGADHAVGPLPDRLDQRVLLRELEAGPAYHELSCRLARARPHVYLHPAHRRRELLGARGGHRGGRAAVGLAAAAAGAATSSGLGRRRGAPSLLPDSYRCCVVCACVECAANYYA